MTCPYCQTHWFWKKIGRCQRCMVQLMILSVLSWIVWWLMFRDTPSSIQSVTLIVAGVAFNGLLFLHLWMKFVVLPWQKKRQPRQRR